MSLFQLLMLRSWQPIVISRMKSTAAAAAVGTKKAPTNKATGDSFIPEEALEAEDHSEVPEGSTGRERSLNRIQLIGRVGADPKVGGTEQHKVVTFNLATNEYAGTNTTNGEIKQRVDWHRIAVFQPRLLDNAEKYVRQGDRIYIQGRLHHNRIRDKESGNDRYVTSIIADDMIFLTKK